MTDEHGYPDDEELEMIKNWNIKEVSQRKELMDFVKGLWKNADIGYWEDDGNFYKISTTGWSGNEDLIGAMMDNRMFWLICWVSSRRGGHYEFELTRTREEEHFSND